MAQEELEKLKEALTREKSRGSGLALMHFGKTCGVSAYTTRLQSSARNFERIGVGDVAGFAAKII